MAVIPAALSSRGDSDQMAVQNTGLAGSFLKDLA